MCVCERMSNFMRLCVCLLCYFLVTQLKTLLQIFSYIESANACRCLCLCVRVLVHVRVRVCVCVNLAAV